LRRRGSLPDRFSEIDLPGYYSRNQEIHHRIAAVARNQGS
jgi:hypothetical protein